MSLWWRGFSLIELLVVLAIVSILAALCYPNYQQYVLRSYRTEAAAHLWYLANMQEQTLANSGQYSNDFTVLGSDAARLLPRYLLQVTVSANGQAFELIAQAKGPQSADKDCLVLTLNQLGQRNIANTGALSCWQ